MGNRALTAAEWAVLHGKSGPNVELQDALIDDAHGILPSDLVSEPIGFGTQSGIGAGVSPYVSPQRAPVIAAAPQAPAPAPVAPVATTTAPLMAAPAPAFPAPGPAQNGGILVQPAPIARPFPAQAVAQPRSVPPPRYSSSSLSDEYPVKKSGKGLWIGLGGLVVVAAAAFGIRAVTAGPDAAPATQPTSNTTTTTTTATAPTSTAAMTATARDIPPPPAATEVAPPVETAKAAPVATAPVAPPPKLAPPPPAVRPPPTTKATAKQAPRTPPPSAPSKPPAKPGGGGIVRDVPF
jgi:hypothetical protein